MIYNRDHEKEVVRYFKAITLLEENGFYSANSIWYGKKYPLKYPFHEFKCNALVSFVGNLLESSITFQSDPMYSNKKDFKLQYKDFNLTPIRSYYMTKETLYVLDTAVAIFPLIFAYPLGTVELTGRNTVALKLNIGSGLKINSDRITFRIDPELDLGINEVLNEIVITLSEMKNIYNKPKYDREFDGEFYDLIRI